MCYLRLKLVSFIMEVPKNDKSDYVHVSVKAILSLVPTIGGVASELFNILVTSPIEKRRQEWMESITASLLKLESKQSGWLETIKKDEEFHSLLITASISAFRTHLKEKREGLRNCLFNSIRSNASFEIKQLYMRFVDELTIPHLQILQFLIQFEDRITLVDEYQKVYNILIEGTTDPSVPRMERIEVSAFRFLLKDLEAKGLVYISSDMRDIKNQVYESVTLVSEDVEDSKLPFIKATEFGKDFLILLQSNDF